jgi:hypothetical protein
MNGALLLLKHGANIEAQDEHVSIDLVKVFHYWLLCLLFSLKHRYLKQPIIYHLQHGKS